MPQIINWQLAKNPYNYVVVGLMVLIAGVVVHLLFPQFGTVLPGDKPPAT